MDFDTHLMKLVPRVAMDPMLIYATTSKEQFQIGLKLLLDTCRVTRIGSETFD